jgi:hypothetical protein
VRRYVVWWTYSNGRPHLKEVEATDKARAVAVATCGIHEWAQAFDVGYDEDMRELGTGLANQLASIRCTMTLEVL